MILEGIVTSLNTDGSLRVAPMGPEIVDAQWQRFLLRPYRSSHTLGNLKRTRQGVLHVTDDVLLFARAAIGRWDSLPATEPAQSVEGQVLCDCCRWFEFRVLALDESQQRAALECEVVARGQRREFVGFCRAKHAVVEAAILATRVAFLAPDLLLKELQRLAPLVDKTGDQPERQAFELLRQYISDDA